MKAGAASNRLRKKAGAVTAQRSRRAGIEFIGVMAMVERGEGDGIAFPVGKCDTTNGSRFQAVSLGEWTG